MESLIQQGFLSMSLGINSGLFLDTNYIGVVLQSLGYLWIRLWQEGMLLKLFCIGIQLAITFFCVVILSQPI